MRKLVWVFVCRTFPYCCKSHVMALAALLRQAITDLFCFVAKSTRFFYFKRHIHKLNSNSQHVIIWSQFKKKRELTNYCVNVHFFDMKTKKNGIKKMGSARIRTHNLHIWSYGDWPHVYNFIELSTVTKTFISVIARNKSITHDPSRKKYIFSVNTYIL